VLLPIRDHNPRAGTPVVTLVLIALNVAAFLLMPGAQDPAHQAFVMHFGAVPARVVNQLDVTSIWTSMFLHGGWMHLIGNMWFLWVFGDNVEESLGPVRYALFYMAVGTVGALAQIAVMPQSTIPMIGASGAVAGALGAYAMLFPRHKVQTFVAIPFLWHFRDIPAWIFLGLWFLMQFLIPSGSGVAWMAHVGGFLAGVALARLLARRPRAALPVEVEYLPPPRRRW
jgi:membrane associated rhomboid family serine protease